MAGSKQPSIIDNFLRRICYVERKINFGDRGDRVFWKEVY
jgi:hypothetical protein